MRISDGLWKPCTRSQLLLRDGGSGVARESSLAVKLFAKVLDMEIAENWTP